MNASLSGSERRKALVAKRPSAAAKLRVLGFGEFTGA